jgi:hypothetical protein
MANSLAIDGTSKGIITLIPRIHVAHTIPYRLAKPPSSTNLTYIIRNLQTFIKT